MAVKLFPRSRFNPHAPLFVPASFLLAIDDFSPQWWLLVRSSPSFSHLWLRSRYCIDDDGDDESQPESESASSLSLQDMDELDAVDDLYDLHAQLVDMEIQAEQDFLLGLDSQEEAFVMPDNSMAD
jgi:hypothetical protein